MEDEDKNSGKDRIRNEGQKREGDAIRNEIKEIEKLGRMPDESENDLSNELINLYADLLHKIEKPVNWAEAKILIKLFPESGLFGVEWSLLHLFETIFPCEEIEEYVQLIAECPSEEWREHLLQRVENWKTRNLCSE